MRKRNHPAYILKSLVLIIKQTIIPILALLAAQFSRLSWWVLLLIGMGIFLVMIIISILKWTSTVYYIEDNKLFFEKGILNKSKQALPIDRITTFNLNQGIFEQLFRLTTVKIDMGAVSNESEVKLMISLRDADDLGVVIKGTVDEVTAESAANENKVLEFRVSSGELIKYAVFNSNMLFGIVILSAMGRFVDDIPFVKGWTSGIFSRFGNEAESMINKDNNVDTLILFGVSILIIYLVITFIVSLIRTIVKYFGFVLAREGNVLRIQYGLFDAKKYAIDTKKITALYISTSFLGNIFGFCELKIENMGYGDESGESAILYPLLKKNKVDNVLEQVLPEFKQDANDFLRPSKRAYLGYIGRFIAVPLIAACVVSYLFEYGFLLFILVFYLGICGHLSYKNSGIAITKKERIVLRGMLRKETIIVKNKFIQSVTIKQNPFQKRKDLSSLRFFYQSNHSGKNIGIKGVYLPEVEVLKITELK